MAKEEDVKKIELKVSVNCCDGCRKKVLKALSIKGVLRTDIHPSLPKVTVLGNVEPQTLIKKLAKCGKTAEVWPAEPLQKQGREEKKSDSATSSVPEKEFVEVPVVKGADEKPKDAGEGVKKSGGSEQEIKNARSEDKSKLKQGDHEYRCCGKGDKGEGKAQKELAENAVGGEVVKNVNLNCTTATQPATVTTALPPQANYVLNPGMVQDPGGMAPPSSPRVYYAVEPYPAPMASYYTANAYVAPPPPPCCVQDHYYYHSAPPVLHHCPPPPAPVPSLPPQFGDYFNDENTVGCSVM